MWQILLKLLTGPLISGALDAYKQKLAAGNTSERIAADLAGRELAVQQREIEVQGQLKTAEIGKWYEPDHLFGYIMVVYFFTVVIWDNVLGGLTHHSTDPIRGEAAVWAGMTMTFYVGMRGALNVARIIKR